MYATIRIYDQAAGLAEAVAADREEILSLFHEVAGFRSYHIVATGAASAVSVTVYDDRAGAEESNRIAKDYIARKFTDLSIGAPTVLGGEVAMSG